MALAAAPPNKSLCALEYLFPNGTALQTRGQWLSTVLFTYTQRDMFGETHFVSHMNVLQCDVCCDSMGLESNKTGRRYGGCWVS